MCEIEHFCEAKFVACKIQIFSSIKVHVLLAKIEMKLEDYFLKELPWCKFVMVLNDTKNGTKSFIAFAEAIIVFNVSVIQITTGSSSFPKTCFLKYVFCTTSD